MGLECIHQLIHQLSEWSRHLVKHFSCPIFLMQWSLRLQCELGTVNTLHNSCIADYPNQSTDDWFENRSLCNFYNGSSVIDPFRNKWLTTKCLNCNNKITNSEQKKTGVDSCTPKNNSQECVANQKIKKKQAVPD